MFGDRPFKIIAMNTIASIFLRLPTDPEKIPEYRRKNLRILPFSMDGLTLKLIEIPTRGEHTLPARVYIPTNDSPLAIVVYFHGGGFVLGGNGSHSHIVADIARKTPAVVVDVDFRLAPEAKCPKSSEDCYDATKWIYEHAEEFGANPSRLIVAGDSSGGNMATITCHRAKELGFNPPIFAQILIYASLDLARQTPSSKKYASGYVYSVTTQKLFYSLYLNQQEDAVDPWVSPLRQPNQSKLPTTLIQAAEMDMLRDESLLYAEALKNNGVEVQSTVYNGTIHGFYSLPSMFSQSYEDGIKEIVNFIKNKTEGESSKEQM